MTRFTRVQSAHTYGVLDPHVIERRDTKFVDASLADGRNIVIMPQGGYTDRGGTDDYGRVRRQIAFAEWTAGMATLPNGGTGAGLLARQTQTTSGVAGSRFTLAEVDFGAEKSIAFIDITNIKVATTGADDALIAEYWTGSAWQTFGASLLLTTSARTRRFAGYMTTVSARKFRVCVDATTAAGAASFSGLDFWSEAASLSEARLERYHYRANDVHQLVVSDRNIDVFAAGTWKASIPLPAPESIIAELKFEFGYDTILVFHQDMAPQQITRLGAADEWSCEPVVFENIPLADYGGIYTNGIDEFQSLLFSGFTGSELFHLIVEGKSTTAIAYSTVAADLINNIKVALENLPNVEEGLTVTRPGPDVIFVQFSGAGNAGRDWLTMAATVQTAGRFITVTTLTEGKAPGEAIMSQSRGWPSVGRLVQKRLVLAGFKSKPNSILASVTGAPFDLNTELSAATAAFLYDLGDNEANVIRDIFQAKTLIFFGSAQHAWLKNNVLSAEDLPQFGFSDAPGIDARIRPVSTNNSIMYVQAGGSTLQMLAYTEIEQNFIADNASVLSAHLIKEPVDMTRRRSSGAIDSDLLVMPNKDGSATVLTLMRTQEVSGYAPWATDGKFRSVQVDQNNELWFLVERMSDGSASLRLEKHEPLELLDEAETRTVEVATDIFTGLERFNGRQIWAVTTAEVFGPVAVAGGTATFPEKISGAVRLGSWTAPLAKDPEIYLEQETGRRQARLKRINRAQFSVVDTTSLALAVNDGPVTPLSLVNTGELILGQGPLERPFTGTVEAEGMHGFTKHGQMTVTQSYPGRMTVRRVSKDVVA